MKKEMFCYQCQETACGTGCTVQGVCGKTAAVAALQDKLVFLTKGLGAISEALRAQSKAVAPELTTAIIYNLFTTITNANFYEEAIQAQIDKSFALRDQALKVLGTTADLPYAARISADELEALTPALLTDCESTVTSSPVGVLATADEDVRSLRELITYGLKGLAAYYKHANALGATDESIAAFLSKALAATVNDGVAVPELISLALETGEYGVKAMALLDGANTGHYGNPEITEVSIEAGSRPGILISGHDLHDLEMLLEQSKDAGVDVYTHSEMLPAHYYPAFKKYSHLKGNYGNAWWKQLDEFETFNGPILMTTNCIVPPRESYKGRMFTTGAAGYPGCKHIDVQADGTKDFSEIIALAKTCQAPKNIETGSIIGGFAHAQVLSLADKVIDAVKAGAIKRFVVMAGCDGRQSARSYYTDFAKALPQDTVILTAGCAKYKYNKLNLGDIGGIPRVLDAGQCNDSYSLALIALALKDAFGLDDINDLPVVYNIAWYEQKAVIVLLALLHLGVKNIHLGPSLPAFLSPNVAKVLVDTFGIAGIGTVESDLEKFDLNYGESCEQESLAM